MAPIRRDRADGAAFTGIEVIGSPPTETSAAPKRRLHQLDGLRGIAMLLVFLGHFSTVWSPAVTADSARCFLRLIEADGTFGSSFFMLLSGFFGYGSLMRGNRPFSHFMRGRIWRLYPLYSIMVAVYVVGSLVVPGMSKLPASPVAAAVFVTETLVFLPGLLPIAPLMDAAWTLSFVVLFYFIAGALARLFHRWGVARLSRFILLLLAAGLWAVLGDFKGVWEPRTAIFWVGMALWEAVDGISGARRRLLRPLNLLSVALTVSGVLLRTELMLLKPDTGFVPILLCRFVITSATLFGFVWFAYFGPEWWKNFLSGPQLRKLGAASYSFYLTHGFAVKAFRFGIVPRLGPAANAAPAFWACQIGGIVLSVAIARMVFAWVETPLSRLAPARGGARQPVYMEPATTFAD